MTTTPARLLALLALALSAALACGGGEPAATQRTPLVVIGIDGGEWRVIEDLWSRGQLPHLERLAEEGVRAHLLTAYTRSPVIWTTIATGRQPAEHGITDFLVPGPDGGEVPVSSRVRRVPALWNMTARVGLRTHVLGWWASWPAETVAGVVVSDRAHATEVDAVSPASWAPRFAALRAAALDEANEFGGNPAAKARDQTMAYLARHLAADPFALMLVYFRGVDIASHTSWKYYRPEGFAAIPADELAARRDDIPAVYRATDKAIGDLIAALGRPADLLVVSDHGFRAARHEKTVEGRDGTSWTISGEHSERTHGIFIAHGPSFDPAAVADGITIHDIAPTVLYALGLPVADDFAGRPFTELFRDRDRRATRRIASWGTMESWGAPASPVDEELIEELRALGYL